MREKRIFHLDLIRVVALFCIIWCHTDVVEFDSYFLEKIKWFLGKCGVPLFFMTSGYLAFPMNKPIRQYCIAKIKRVVLPFIVWVLIYAVLELIQGNPIFLNGDLLNAGSAHLWFVYVIIGLYLVVPVLDPFLRNADRKLQKFYLVLWGITGLYPLLLSYTGSTFNEHNWTYTLYYLNGYIGYFILGNYFRKYGEDTRILKLTCSFAFIVISIFLMVIYFFVFDCQTVVVSDYKGLPMIFYSIAMFGIVKKAATYLESSRLCNAVVSLSVYSFGIYLLHMVVIMFIYPIMPIYNAVPDIVTTFVFVAVCICISYLIVRICANFRFYHYIFG